MRYREPFEEVLPCSPTEYPQIKCGLIMSDGTFYICDAGYHASTMRQLLRQEGACVDADNRIDVEQEFDRRNAIRISNNKFFLPFMFGINQDQKSTLLEYMSTRNIGRDEPVFVINNEYFKDDLTFDTIEDL